ncbi:MAG: glycosyltransferase family 4 protein [Roseburia sp.]|nr:glycosyltransferase family 4 protein [Roseburia sp.]
MRREKIRILHVAQAAGGVDRYIRMLLRYLDKRKYENIVVLSQDFKEEDYIDIADKFEQVRMQREIGRADIDAIRQIRTLIKNYQPDIVYAHSSKAGAIARIADIGLPNHCVYNPHGWAFSMISPHRKLYKMIEKAASFLCEKIICISEYEREAALRNHICPKDKLQLIFNGVDIKAYEKRKAAEVGREALGIDKGAFVVGMAARLTIQKAPDVFVKAARLIKEEFPDSVFLLVGDGDMRLEIDEYAEKNGLNDSLFITGWIPNPMDYIELFDVAVLTTRWEGFGLVLPEYMLAEKPVIATKAGAVPNIIRNEWNGLLVDVDDYYAVYEAVKRLRNDFALCQKLIANGKDIVYRKFDARRVAQEHELLFGKMTGDT